MGLLITDWGIVVVGDDWYDVVGIVGAVMMMMMMRCIDQ